MFLTVLPAILIIIGIQTILQLLPATNPTVQFFKGLWRAFWNLLGVASFVGIILTIIALIALFAGVALGNVWVMLLAFIVLQFLALGLRFELSIFGLGAQGQKITEFGLVLMLTWALISFVLRVAGSILGTPGMMVLFVLSVLVWVINVAINRDDPHKYAKACAWVMILFWVVAAPVTLAKRDEWMQAFAQAKWFAPKEKDTEENLLDAAITRQLKQITEVKRDRIQNHKENMYVYIDLIDSPVLELKDEPKNARLFGYSDDGAIIKDNSLQHGELVLWIVDRTIPQPIANGIQKTVGAAHVLKADENGQFLESNSGLWIPLLKGTGAASYLSTTKPQPLPTNPGGGEKTFFIGDPSSPIKNTGLVIPSYGQPEKNLYGIKAGKFYRLYYREGNTWQLWDTITASSNYILIRGYSSNKGANCPLGIWEVK